MKDVCTQLLSWTTGLATTQEEWSGREDSNLRPPGPETEADVLTY